MAEETLRAVVTADITQFQSALTQMAQLVQRTGQAMSQAFGGGTEQVLRAIQQQTQQLATGFATMGEATSKASQTARQALAALETQTTQLTRTIQSHTQTMNQAFGSVTTQLGTLGTSMTELSTHTAQANTGMARASAGASGFSGALTVLTGTLGALGIANIGQQLVEFAKDSVQVAAKMEQLHASFRSLSGGMTAGKESMAFLRAESQRLGLDFVKTAEGFRGLEAATRGTRMEGEEARKLFSAFSGAMRVVGGSTEQVHRGLVALQQMIAKGKVEREDLRGQLAEAFPQALGVAARALGKTSAEFETMMKRGEVLLEFFPKFRQQLEEEFAGGVAEAAKTATAEFARFGNAMTDLKNALGGAILPPLASLLKVITGLVEELTGARKEAEAIINLQKRAAGEGVPGTGKAYGGTVQLGLEQAIDAAETRIKALQTEMTGITGQKGWQPPSAQQQQNWEGPGFSLFRSPLEQMQRSWIVRNDELNELLNQRETLTARLTEILKQERQMALDIQEGIAAPVSRETAVLQENLSKILEATEKKLQTIDQQYKMLENSFKGKAAKDIKLPEEVEAAIAKLAPKFGLEPRLVEAIVAQESGGLRMAQSEAGAQGLMQLMPKTGAAYGVTDPWDMEQNLRGGMAYMRDLLKQYQSLGPVDQLRTALAAYNAGPGAVKQYGGIPPYPETKNYVGKIMGALGEKAPGAVNTRELDAINDKLRIAEKAAVDFNEELAKHRNLIEVMPPIVQQEIDKMQAGLGVLREKKQAIEEQIERQKTATSEINKDAAEQERVQEALRKQAFDAVLAIGKERQKALEAEEKDTLHAAETIAGLRIDVANEELKEEEQARKEMLKNLFEIESDATREMAAEQKRHQQEVAKFVEGVQRQLSSTIFQIFKGQKDVFQGIYDLFLKLLADMAAAALTNQIVIPILSQLFGAEGQGGFMSQLTGAGTGAGAGAGVSGAAGAADTLSGAFSSGAGGSLYQQALGGLLNQSVFSWGDGGAGATAAQTALGSGSAGTQTFYSTPEGGFGEAAQAGTAPTGGGGMVTAGQAVGAIGTGIATGFMVNKGLTALGLSGRSRSFPQVANTALSGAAGGALAGTQIMPGWGTVIGAVVGLIGGLVAGLTSGQADRQKFDVTEQRAARFVYNEQIGIQQSSAFQTETAKTSRLDTYTKNLGMTGISEAATTLFDNMTGQIRQMDPKLQAAAVGPLNAYADSIASLVEGTKFQGKKQVEQIKSFIATELPTAFNQLVDPLIEGLNTLQPIVAQFREVIEQLEASMDELEAQQKAYTESLAGQVKSLGEATMTERQLFARRRDELSVMQEQLATASPLTQMKMIPKAQELIDTIFQLGTQALQEIVGQFENIMNELHSTLTSLNQQQAQMRGNLESQIQAMVEATYTPAMLFMKRQSELRGLQAQLPGASPSQRIAMIPQAQQLIDQMFQLGATPEVFGQEPEAVRALQGEMVQLLRDLQGTSDMAFEAEKTIVNTQINLAQQQLDVLKSGNITSSNLLNFVQAAEQALQNIHNALGTNVNVSLVGGNQVVFAGLQGEMVMAVQALQGVSDAAFTTQRALTQNQIDLAHQQIEYLAANLLNTANLQTVAADSLKVLADIRTFMVTGELPSGMAPIAAPAAPSTAPAELAGPVPPGSAPVPGGPGWIGPTAETEFPTWSFTGQENILWAGSAYGHLIPAGSTLAPQWGAGGWVITPDGQTMINMHSGQMVPYGPSYYPQYQLGTPFVPQTGFALLHRGEAVVPAGINTHRLGGGMGGDGPSVSLTIHAPITIQTTGTTADPEQLAQQVSEHVQRQIELRSRFGQSTLRSLARA